MVAAQLVQVRRQAGELVLLPIEVALDKVDILSLLVQRGLEGYAALDDTV